MSSVGKARSERDGGISEKCLDDEPCSCHACQPNQHRTPCESASPSSKLFDAGLREGIFVGVGRIGIEYFLWRGVLFLGNVHSMSSSLHLWPLRALPQVHIPRADM